ncbi:MAG: hypothetical protein Q9222_001099 [Ikaeria aurantiellina]
MMYRKALAAKDPKTAQRILATPHPGEQKWLGRGLKNLDEKQWKKISFDVVVEGSLLKFQSNNDLKKKLLATGDRELVEASPSDRTWGIGFEAAYAEQQRASWGQNLLGKALMTIRAQLQAEAGRSENSNRTAVVVTFWTCVGCFGKLRDEALLHINTTAEGVQRST